jgi:hypothetical protein
MVDVARRHAEGPERHARIAADLTELYLSRAQAHGCRLSRETMRELLAMDIELNAQGLEVWLDRNHGG